MSRHAPRKLSDAMAGLTDRLAPQTGLGAVQRVWADAVGPVIAANATPTAEREGTLTVTCASSVWAAEVDLLGPELLAKLNERLGAGRLTALRCTAAASRTWLQDA
jgi:predicted nucleic acid-binding Zn ribbon protein